MRYCTECGSELNEESTFCTECGTNQTTSKSTKNVVEKPLHSKTSNVKTFKPLSKKNKILIASIAIIFIAVFATHKIFSNYYDPMAQLKEIDQAVNNGDSELLFSHIDYDEDALLDKDQFINHLQESDWEFIRTSLTNTIMNEENNSFHQTVKDFSGNKVFVVKVEEELLGLYQKYIFEAVPNNLYAISNYSATKLNLLKKDYEIESADEPTEIVKAYPGTYNFKAILDNEFGSITLDEQVVVMGDGNNQDNLYIDFPVRQYHASSNMEDAILYINGVSTGKTLEEYEILGPFPDGEKVEMYAEWSAPNGKKVKSETITQEDVSWGGLFFDFDLEVIESLATLEIHDERNIENASENASNEDIVANHILSFRDAYEVSLNTRDFSHIEGFMLSDSHAYDELKTYIGKLKDQGYKYDFIENSILETNEIADGKFEVSTNEHFIFTNHEGKQTEYNRSKIYTVIEVDGTYKIQKIDINDTDRNKI
ncbi:TcaA NTF2-like domain-containing protein [Pseudalkalibacillus sp. Hm43]|uniref:TcaA NTF2-like domain-containing protein n=1 Tax=Pseudalkalibacillus sp. Hm43 TaxID=3450742 RepID=UPI003F42119B